MNFVLAHGSCNLDKRDMLAAPMHLARWVERNDRDATALRQIFDDAHFLYDMDASLTVAEWSYETAERSGALVWVRKKGETAPLTGG